MDFHNPYNFVSALPRRLAANTELGDRNPLKIGMGHGVYQNNRWSGRISVKLTTKTPLLIPDIFDHEEERGKEKGHKTYPLRVGTDGKPYLPPTSIKGMLRSAYEAITNSRFGVFEKHSDRLAYRMPATHVDVEPAIVWERKDKSLYIRVLEKFGLLKRYLPKSALLLKNNLPLDKGESEAATKFNGSEEIPKHGDRVLVKLDDEDVVKSIIRYDKTRKKEDWQKQGWEEGFVCITGASIEGKIYERVFIVGEDEDRISVTPEISAMWTNLITNYQEGHQKDLEKRKKSQKEPKSYLGHKPGETALSRHIYLKSEAKLKFGTLCYVEVTKDLQIKSISPVMISRKLHDLAPEKLLDRTLHPATSMDELSPADRVFGWVNQDQDGKGAYKGNLRIHSVKCESVQDVSIQQFPNGLSLGILGQPKPQQARFYIAKDKQGTPLDKGIDKQDGYSDKNGLRGRKVYPHHQVSDWSNPRDPNQEYRQTERSDQNRSVKGWVKPDTNFRFDIDITNLSSVELGGLLWLLSLPENHYHRLGGGKPFGFGSVSLAIAWQNTDLRTGSSWREFYSNLSLVDAPDRDAAKKTIQIFQDEVGQVYKDKFQDVKFIKAFCQAAKGFDDDKPIHYPRLQEAQVESFKWFVENESTRGQKMSLPDLTKDRGLPYNPRN